MGKLLSGSVFVLALTACGSQGPAGPPGPSGAIGQTGGAGAIGPAAEGGQSGAGANGSASNYGNGSAGAKVISANGVLGDTDTNLQYTDFTVNANVTLTVASGTVIRCSGKFTNNGTIEVDVAAKAGAQFFWSAGTSKATASAPAGAGLSLRAAGEGEFGPTSADVTGGLGGVAMTKQMAMNTLLPGVLGGGAGFGQGVSGVDTPSENDGGGTLVVLAKGELGNTATGLIRANGRVSVYGGSGGGAGGIVVLASATSITSSGDIHADGAPGTVNTDKTGVGGGGGGGIVHFLAPIVNAGKTPTVVGAAPGTPNGNLTTAAAHLGGGGGGACGGDGGDGGDLSGNDPLSGESGQDGFVLTTLLDPSALF